jgi:hypothetical protein
MNQLGRRLDRLEAVSSAAAWAHARAQVDRVVARYDTDSDVREVMDTLISLVEASTATPPEDWQADPCMVAAIEREHAEHELPDQHPPWLWLYRWQQVTATPMGRVAEARLVAFLDVA